MAPGGVLSKKFQKRQIYPKKLDKMQLNIKPDKMQQINMVEGKRKAIASPSFVVEDISWEKDLKLKYCT